MLVHHLIDPRTGAPAVTDILSVTVVAARLPDAEIYAKTALILGEAEGRTYLDGLQNISAIMVTEDDRHLMCGHFEDRAYVSSTNWAERFGTPA
jgi:thiamine biosynthesis lipoprotein